jgi:hypothetical protein
MKDAARRLVLAERRWRSSITFAGSAGLAVFVPLAESYLVLKVWITCDIGGINAGVSEMTVILFVLPALLIAHAAAPGSSALDWRTTVSRQPVAASRHFGPAGRGYGGRRVPGGDHRRHACRTECPVPHWCPGVVACLAPARILR